MKKKKPSKRYYDYFNYINSKEWEMRKESYYKTHKKKCSACDTTRRIQLHHIKYPTRFGKEPDYYMIPFCYNCHQEYHQFLKQYQTMKKDNERLTAQYIQYKRGKLKNIKTLVSQWINT